METRAHYVLIGAFMLGGIVLAILFTLWLGSNRAAYDEYRIVFTQKISGLQVGANVLFNGIPVGQVESLELDQDNPNRSLATVRVAEGTPVKTDTGVELELTGVTGLAVVQFVGGSAEAPLLKDAVDNRVPVIDANLSGIAAAIESSGELVFNLQRLISEQNAEAVGRILADIESLTDVMSDKENEFSLIIDNAAVASTELLTASRNLSAATASIDKSVQNIETLLESDGERTLQEIASAAEGVDDLVAELNLVVTENREAIADFTTQGLASTVSMVNKASRLVDTTQAILLEFDRNPAAFLLGEGRPTAN